MGDGALTGIRVIELGQLIAGPFCGQLLADHGAEVWKVEAPGQPDPMRVWGQGKPVWFPVIGRNKRTVTLDLREASGRDRLKRLVRRTDILVENFRPGTMERWGLGWEVLHQENPGLIMVRVSGYGQTGPYATRAGFGAIGEAMGGLRAVTGEPDRPAARVGISIGDSLAATFACVGALMALHHRHRTGEGQVVDSAIYEAVLAVMESTVPEFSEAGVTRQRSGAILPGIAPSNVYPCRDGEVLIGANQDSVFQRLADAMGEPGLATDPRFATHLARGQRQRELDGRIADWTAARRVAEVLDLMEAHGVPAGRLYTAADMLEDPHFQAREALVKVAHPAFRNLWMQNVVPKLSATPGRVRWAGRRPGADDSALE
jgi:crotonobetainyl-CoA:carnitine CoA-transferase CaiB-like acyl-CoA transferase